ncbi:MAG TPA: biotin--protein ligase [Desulfovibrio sp.]|nr:biotin--protein ligase [Desulfovibrio sp.]
MLAVLWDASPLWGHLALNTVIQTGLPYEIVTAKECQENILKEKAFNVLIVPGGAGKQKANLLGQKGMDAVRNFVAEGGAYLGFCGGAGLALEDGLALCPWGRDFYEGRIEHRISGHIYCDIFADNLIPQDMKKASLPVWWPGRFQEPGKEEIARTPSKGEVRVLARYREMGEDFYSHDLPVCSLPQNTLEDWENVYGVRLKPKLLDGQPAIIAGSYGKGQYILSYSHLETADSKDANQILAHMLKSLLTGTDAGKLTATGTAFEVRGGGLCKNILNTDEFSPRWIQTDFQTTWPLLRELDGQLQKVFQLGENLHLLFRRNDWLYGWDTNVHGSQLNALRIALARSLVLPPTEKREEYIIKQGLTFAENMLLFIHGTENWFLARKLCNSLAENERISPELMESQRKELFGMLMYGGGRCGELIAWLDTFLLLGKQEK